MKKLVAMYRPLEGDLFNMDMIECDSSVTEFNLYNDFGKGSMVLVWFPTGFDFDEAFETAGSEEWGDVVGLLLPTEAKNMLYSANYEEFVQVMPKIKELYCA